MDEKKLKQIFVGKKFDKFEKKVFSIPAFFFGGLYFAYRKMLIHSIIVTLVVSLMDSIAMKLPHLNLTIISTLCIHIALGLFFPLWYRKFYNNKVNSLLAKSVDKSEQDIINLTQKQGGTSVAYLIIFIIINSVLMNYFNKIDIMEASVSTNVDSNQIQEVSSEVEDDNFEVIEDAKITGYAGFINKYTVYIGKMDNPFETTEEDAMLLSTLSDYKDQISITIYYTESADTKKIEKYEIYNKETNEKIENVKNEEDLRKALDLYLEGNYEENFKFIKQSGMPGGGFIDNVSFTYYDYIFQSEDGKDFEFVYRIYKDTEDKSDILEEGENYKIKFTVQKSHIGDDYEYEIIDMEKI